MLEQFVIFARGGLILWSFGNALRGSSPLDALIRFCLLEERSGASSYNYPNAPCTLKFALHNQLQLVFVAVYCKSLPLLYVDDLLARVKKEFSVIYHPNRTVYYDFNHTFQQLKKEAEARAQEIKKPNQVTPSNSRGGNDKRQGRVQKGLVDVGENKKSVESEILAKKSSGDSKENGAFDVSKLQRFRGRGAKKTENHVNKASKHESKKKITKKMRVWDDSPPKQILDYTDSGGNNVDENVAIVATDHGESLMDKEEVFSSDSDEEEEIVNDGKSDPKKKGWLSSIFQSISGKASLDKADLEPALKALKDKLMTKNVAEKISVELCESVAASLEGKKLASFTRISSIAQIAVEDALLRILTTEHSIDILRDVHAAKERREPYVVVFVGVNGVGKSNNLAKVAYWLQQHEVNVMMAACDTFRSGAVEQLRTHARRLQIPIFEKGYNKDPSTVAKEAIKEARRNGCDVVLVDTAGRMQDNTPLMSALAKLIYNIKPNLILFVGEALVGNDAVDQLSKFNQKLCELAPASEEPRLINGILLTKFDTIDDKVGDAVSMVSISRSPVMFVGCGQSYTDLKKLNVRTIVKTLLN